MLGARPDQVACPRPVTAFLPLILVLGISMLKELIEDVKRYRADREVNSRLVECYDVGTGKLVRKAWRHVKVWLTIHLMFSAVC